ncbi:hypothetical protein NUU61_007156 [Penicillium alfredii]|uniref:Ankyrin repeat protein n=1 Tax=Penicillium alfredii TaxID=1506179 RepID=A0A9W9F2D7_9EURO|nr:uncharacterized protein NUU61_007156 [Penicillium alfredii]KAJ5092286.1 hypothetical protein NUU61_007156 [Penicillium alfredii]
MDPVSAFGVFSGGIQVLQAIVATVHGLNELYGRFRDADLTIQSLIQELNCIQTALTSLREWARASAANGPSPDEYHDSLAVAMNGCRVIMEVLSQDVAALVQGGQEERLAGFRARVRVVWNDELMRGHQEKLHAQVMALQLLLQVCQCHSSAEQVRLLRRATTRQIIRQVADDTQTLLSSRSRTASRAGSMSQSSGPAFSERAFDFDRALAGTSVYRAQQQRIVPTVLSPESHSIASSHAPSLFTDVGYNSSRTGTLNLNTSSLEVPAQQQGYLALPSSPSAPPPQRPDGSTVRRWHTESAASSRTARSSPSTRERISSFLGRMNSRSRSNFQPSSPAGGRGRRRDEETDINTSIDLTSTDVASIPPIVKAAQAGSSDEVERLIERGCDPEERHKRSSRNALLVAAHCGREEVVDLLIQRNARLAVTDGSGWTALHLAASRGHCGVLEMLLAEGNLIEAPNFQGRTALRVAADRGQLEALQVLLMHDAKANARAENQMTALHAVVKTGDQEIVQLLVSHGADLEAKDGTMMTALHYACEAGHLGVISVLLDHRADIETPGRDRKTPLICAAEAGQLKAVELLLKRKASSRSTDDTGMTALHWAAYNGHEEIVGVLCQKKGSLNMVNAMGRAPLHLAVIQSQFAVVELLLRKGAPLDKRCKTGLTALHYACMADASDIARLLLLAGADIEAPEDQHQQRPLHIVASWGSIHLLDLLCEKGASLNGRDGIGDRPLCAASRYGHVAAVQKLLDRGSPLYAKFEDSIREDSPLCLAAMGGHLHVASLLLDKGASSLRKDETGWQPFRYAAYHGHPDVLQLLLSCSNIPELDIPDMILMPETIGFSPHAHISDERKWQVQGLLNQALVHPESMAKGANSSVPRTESARDSNSRSCPLPLQLTREVGTSTRQELPGNLEQGLPSSRSATPERVHRDCRTGPIDAVSHPDRQEVPQINDPRLSLVSDRVAASLNDGREVSPRPWGTRSPSRSRTREESPGLSAVYIPRPVPIRWSAPSTQAPGMFPDHGRPGESRISSQASHSNQDGAEQVPRTVDTSQISGSELQAQNPQAVENHSDSDSISISSVYTASEGELHPGVTASSNVRSGVYELE